MAQKGHTIYVTHVTSDGPRLKIWGVLDKKNYAYVENIIAVLSNKFSQQQGVAGPQNTILPDALCCVNYRGKYVRAKILNSYQNGVSVKLIDSGVVDFVPVELVRILYRNSPEEDLLSKIPPLAIEVFLANILSVGDEWECRVIESIVTFIKDKELEISHYDKYGSQFLVNLVYCERDVGNMLVEKRMAKIATLDDMFKSPMYSQQPNYKVSTIPHQQQHMPAQQMTTNGFSGGESVYHNSPHMSQMSTMQTNMEPDSWRFNQSTYVYQPPHRVQQPITPVPRKVEEDQEQPSIFGFRIRLLQVGTRYPVLISFVDDGPTKFAVQLMENRDVLMSLMEQIQEHDPVPLKEPPLPGLVCLARLRQQRSLCRAVVMATLDTQIKIFFVDFGHTECVNYTDIYQLPAKFISPKVLSIRICLTGLKEMNITEEVKKYFSDLISGKQVDLVVCEPEGPFLIQYGDIYFHGKNVKEYLKERFPDIASVTYGHIPALTDGTKETVYVSHVSSCSKFFIQLEKNISDLEELMSTIFEYASTAPPQKSFDINTLCIAPYEIDQQWYRVKILEKHGENVKVLYVDYGNEETLNTNQLRVIHKDLVKQMPCQAIHCVLNGFQSRASSSQFNAHFEKLTFEKRLSMTVKNAQPSCMIVDLFDITTTPPKNILGELNKIQIEMSSNGVRDTASHKKSNEIDRSVIQTSQRFDSKEQPITAQRQKFKSKTGKNRDDMDAHVPASGSSNPFRSNNDENSFGKIKSWKDDHNEQKHDNRHQRRDDNDRFNRDDGNERFTKSNHLIRDVANRSFNRDDERKSSFSKDGDNNPFTRDAGNDKFNRSGGGDRFNREGGNDRFNRDGGNDRFNRDGGNDRSNRDGGSNPFNRDGGDDKFNQGGGGDRFNRDGGNDRFNRDGGNDRFDRDRRDGGNDKFNRERREGGNDRFNRDRREGGNDRFNRDRRDGGNERFNNRDRRDGGNDRFKPQNDTNFAASDNESTTSSKGSGGKRGDRGGFEGRKDNRFNRSNNFGNRDDNDGFRSKGFDDNKPKYGRDDGFNKTKKMTNFEPEIDFVKPKKLEIQEPCVTLGGKNRCELVYLTHLSSFYVHLVPQNEKLEELMERIASTYETGGTILESSKVKCNVACIAQYAEDERWYRAIVKSVEGSLAKVFFADYGNMEKISLDKLKEIGEEFVHLPMQAVPCKLFGAKKTEWSDEEIESFGNMTNEKLLEVEFRSKDRDVFQVLLREVVDEVTRPEIINETFCPGVDLTCSSGSGQKSSLDLASPDSRWIVEEIRLGKKDKVMVTWVDSADSFYCQSINGQKEFRPMMEEIQKVYVQRQSVSDSVKLGCPVMAIFAQDGALYRAEILDVQANRNHLVQYVDFGNKALVNQSEMYPVEKRFMTLPRQAIRCSLKNIVPVNGGAWTNQNSQEVEKYLYDEDEFDCTFHEEKNGTYLVSLNNNGADAANCLVENKHAKFSTSSCAPYSVEKAPKKIDVDNNPRFDIQLLPGQTLRVKVSSVETVSKFHVQFSSADNCNQAISSYMKNNDPEVMPQLSSREMCLGAGCLIFKDGEWRRAVIVNRCEKTIFDIKLIDTGAYDKISQDRVLALPGQLSTMQNQAIECAVHGVESSSSLNERLKKMVENKEVIIYVEDVDKNRLIVDLFDSAGCKIALTNDSDDIKISPVCPMPILSSTHKVNVSCANHSNSLWLQMMSDADKDEKLNREIVEFYSQPRGKAIAEPDKLCVVESQGTFCRAKIIRKTDNEAFVNLIDYGINENVSCDKLMVLDSSFHVPHQLAIHVSLNVTLCGTPPEQIKALKPHLIGKEFTATFYNVHKKWIVELVENGVKLSETLTNLKLVKETTAINVTEQTGKAATVDKLRVILSHVESPAQFWLQRMDETSKLDELQRELKNAVSSYPEVDKVLEEGALCAVISEGTWYRAEVIDADEDITTVRLIDYGKTDVINNKPENIRALPDSMKTRKIYGIKCRLDAIPVGSEDWSDSICNWMQTLKSQKSLEATMIAESVPKRVDLYMNRKSVIDRLVEEGKALRVHHEEELIEEIVDVELDPRSAFICHIYSLSNFYVQEEKSVSDLETIQDRLMVANMFPVVNDIKEGSLYVAKFEGDNWYRARVISHSESETKVVFIDYGNIAVVTEIREIPEDVASVPPLARKCSLRLPYYASNWPENAADVFFELSADGATIFLMDVLKEEETSIVKLTLENKDIVEKLAPPKTVFVCHVNSAEEFWVQEENQLSEVEEMQEKLVEAENYSQIEVNEGLICAAKFPDDEQWYRAKVTKHSAEKTVVLFIDYGNSSSCSEIRALPEDLARITPLAKKCCLQLPAGADRWSEEAFDEFCTLAGDGTVGFLLDVVEEKETSVVRMFLGQEKIAEKLVPKIQKKTEERTRSSEQVREKISGKEKLASPKTVFVCHINSAEQFWVQEENQLSEVEEMQEKLVEAENYSQIEVKEGLICAAKFPDDEQWYRAKVTKHSAEKTVVLFTDFGNSSSCSEIRALPEDLARITPLAKKCCLQLPAGAVKWSEEAFDNFCILAGDGTVGFLLDVVEEKETAIVRMFLEEEYIAEKLVTKIQKKTEERIGSSEQVSEEIAVEEKVAPTGTVIFVCHVDSMEEFWVQEENRFSELEEMQEKLVEAENYSQIDVQEGLICAAKFPDDEQWYRAKVTKHGADKTVVLFIDYGNSSSCTEIRALPEDLAKIAPFAKKCCLQLPAGAHKWSEEAFDEFCTLAGDGTVGFLLNVIEEKETAIVKMFLEEENIAEKLVSKIPKKAEDKKVTLETVIEEAAVPEEVCRVPSAASEKSTEEESPKSEETISKSVFISQLNSTREFWVQEEEHSEKLNEVGESLFSFENDPAVKEPKEDLIYAAQFPVDNFWYRAKVISCDENEINVFFIDYGNASAVTELRVLSEDLANVAPLAKKCSLKLPLDLAERTEALDEFNKLSADGTCSFIMSVLEEGDPAIVDLKLDGQSVVNKLLESVPRKGEKEIPQIEQDKEIDQVEQEKETPQVEQDKEILEVEQKEEIPQMEQQEELSQVDQEKEIAQMEQEKELAHVDEDKEVLQVDEDKEILQVEQEKEVPQIEEEIKTSNEEELSDSKYTEETSKSDVKVAEIDEDSVKNNDVSDKIDVETAKVDDDSTKLDLESSEIYEDADNTVIEVAGINGNAAELDESSQVDEVSAKSAEESNKLDEETTKPDKETAKVSETTGQTPDETIKSDSTILLTHIISPTEFWGQIATDSVKIRGHLSGAAEWPIVDEPKEGLVCAAKVNNEWHRVRIESIDNEGVRILLIDQGSTPISSEFRQLPEELVSEAPLSRKYSLQLPSNIEKWTEAATAAFCKYSNVPLSMEILETGAVPTIKLFHRGEDVSEILASMQDDLSSEVTEPIEVEESSNNMTLSNIISPSMFWGQTELVESKVDETQEHSKNVSSLDKNSVEYITNQYSLRMPEVIKEWSTEACKKFSELAANGTVFQYKILEAEKKEVVLTYEGKDVVELLAPLCENLVKSEEIEVIDLTEEDTNISLMEERNTMVKTPDSAFHSENVADSSHTSEETESSHSREILESREEKQHRETEASTIKLPTVSETTERVNGGSEDKDSAKVPDSNCKIPPELEIENHNIGRRRSSAHEERLLPGCVTGNETVCAELTVDDIIGCMHHDSENGDEKTPDNSDEIIPETEIGKFNYGRRRSSAHEEKILSGSVSGEYIPAECEDVPQSITPDNTKINKHSN